MNPIFCDSSLNDFADLCLYSPESYTLDAKRDICNEMVSSSKAILDAMREDFQAYPTSCSSR